VIALAVEQCDTRIHTVDRFFRPFARDQKRCRINWNNFVLLRTLCSAEVNLQ
jgi:hypothetical protein